MNFRFLNFNHFFVNVKFANQLGVNLVRIFPKISKIDISFLPHHHLFPDVEEGLRIQMEADLRVE